MTLTHSVLLALAIFAIGVYGILTRRQLIGILLAVEVILNAANLNVIAFARFGAADPTAGAILPIFVMAIAAAEMVVALAIVIAIHRHQNIRLDIRLLRRLHG